MSISKQRLIKISNNYFSKKIKPPLTENQIKELQSTLNKVVDKQYFVDDIFSLLSKLSLDTIISKDNWFNAILSYMIKKNLLEKSDENSLCKVLNLSILNDWNNSITTLTDITEYVDEGISLNRTFQDGFTPLMMAIFKGKDQIIPKLEAKTKLINKQSTFGMTALFLAIDRNDDELVNTLLDRPDIAITGNFIGISLFDNLRSKKDNKLFNTVVDKLKTTFDASDHYFQEPLYYPLALLDTYKQEQLELILVVAISLMRFFNENPDVRKALIQFLKSKEPLPFKKLNRLAIAFETVSYLRHPTWIKQNESSLCGPASVMQHLAMTQPVKFVYSVLELANLEDKKEKKYLPSIVRIIPSFTKETTFSLLGLWTEVIKHNYNIITGYSKNRMFEALTGLTTPYQLEKMFEDFGYQVDTENMQVTLSTRTKLGKVIDQFRRHILAPYVALPEPLKIYSKKHKEQQDNLERFNELKKWFDTHPKGLITIHLTTGLANQLIKFNRLTPPLFNLIETSHYANILNFVYNKIEDTVSFNFLTWGHDFKVENFKADEFRKGFLGGIMASPKPNAIPRPSN